MVCNGERAQCTLARAFKDNPPSSGAGTSRSPNGQREGTSFGGFCMDGLLTLLLTGSQLLSRTNTNQHELTPD